MSEEDFLTACAGPLEAAYGPMDPTQVRMYFTFLRDYDVRLLAAAVGQLIATSKWLPKIAEIRQAAGNIACGQLVELSASEAWGHAQRALRRIDLDIPGSLAAARELVPGLVWQAMQNCGFKNLIEGRGDWPQKWFGEAFSALLAREKALRMAPPQVLLEIAERRLALKLPPSAAAVAVAKAIGSE